MKRSEMVCTKCVKFDAGWCRLQPQAVQVEDPGNHFCAQGQWHQWSERYQEMEPFYWGEWEESLGA